MKNQKVILLIIFHLVILYSLGAETLGFQLKLPDFFKLSIPAPNSMILSPLSQESGDWIYFSLEGTSKTSAVAEVSSGAISLDWNLCNARNPVLYIEGAENLPEVLNLSLNLVICSEDSSEGLCLMISQDYRINRKDENDSMIELLVERP